MGAHIIIFLLLLYILHERTYFGYRPFFWCCTKPENSRDPETAENPTFLPDYQLSNRHTDTQNETATGAKTKDAANDDVLHERADVYRIVGHMNSRARSLGAKADIDRVNSSVRFFD